jgi:hypothetical protein
MFQAVRAEPLSAQDIDCIERHHAVRAATIRDDVASFPQLADTLREVGERYRDRAGNVTGHILLAWANVNQRDLIVANPAHELVVVDRL